MLTASQSDHPNHFEHHIKTEDIQNSNGDTTSAETAEQKEEDAEVDININNVVCNFTVRCHLNLRQIATHGYNVVYKREQAVSCVSLFP